MTKVTTAAFCHIR